MKIIDSTIRDGLYGEHAKHIIDFLEYYIRFFANKTYALEIGSPLSLGFCKESASIANLSIDLELALRASVLLKDSFTQITTFIQPKFFPLDSLHLLDPSRFSFIRVGIDLSDPNCFRECIPFIEEIEALGLTYFLNLMKFHVQPVSNIISSLDTLLSLHDPIGIYIVDSSGCLSRDYLFYSAQLLETTFLKTVGFHIHDNHRDSTGISKFALQCNYFADGTYLGLGRTGGNCDTNQLLLYSFMSHRYNLDSIQVFFNELYDLMMIWPDQSFVHDYLSSLIVHATRIHSSRLAQLWKPGDEIPDLACLISQQSTVSHDQFK